MEKSVVEINGAIVMNEIEDVTINGEKGIKLGDFNKEYKYFTYMEQGKDEQGNNEYLPFVSKDGIHWVLPISIEVSPFTMANILMELDRKEG